MKRLKKTDLRWLLWVEVQEAQRLYKICSLKFKISINRSSEKILKIVGRPRQLLLMMAPHKLIPTHMEQIASSKWLQKSLSSLKT